MIRYSAAAEPRRARAQSPRCTAWVSPRSAALMSGLAAFAWSSAAAVRSPPVRFARGFGGRTALYLLLVGTSTTRLPPPSRRVGP